MVDFIVIAVVAAVVGAAGLYIYRAKKRGAKCIGCPSGESCGASCSGCSCGCGNNQN